MPAKYSHVKKRNTAGLHKKNSQPSSQSTKKHHHKSLVNPLIDLSISHAIHTLNQLEPAISDLERSISKLLLIRYEQDLARLFSTHLYHVSLNQLPTLVMRCVGLAGPGWIVWNYDSDEVKDFFRTLISLDLREAGERVATKSVLWSYTALRQFALSNNIPVCSKRGLHSLRLLPHYASLKSHLDQLESLPPSTFSKPPHLGTLQQGHEAIYEACKRKYAQPELVPFPNPSSELSPSSPSHHTQSQSQSHSKPHPYPEWSTTSQWQQKISLGYEKLTQTLWNVAQEFDVRGYGLILREKLTTKWCECGCSTDHLGQVCERTVREDEVEREFGSGLGEGDVETSTSASASGRIGKKREWDGRGSGVIGWDTEEEEDIWDVDLDFGSGDLKPSQSQQHLESESETIGDVMEWRYLRAEKEKEDGNVAYRKGDYKVAVKHYELAYIIEPEMPVYQLNLAAAHLKLQNWIEAEKACTNALGQHRSSKGYYRRARAYRMLGKPEEAIKDLRTVLRIQPTSIDAINELLILIPIPEVNQSIDPSIPSTSSSSLQFSKMNMMNMMGRNKALQPQINYDLLDRLGVGYPRLQLGLNGDGDGEGEGEGEGKGMFERRYSDFKRLRIGLLNLNLNSNLKDQGKGKGKGKVYRKDGNGGEGENGGGTGNGKLKTSLNNVQIQPQNQTQTQARNVNTNTKKSRKEEVEENNRAFTAMAQRMKDLGDYRTSGNSSGAGSGGEGEGEGEGNSEKRKRKNEKIREIEYLRTIVNCPTWDNYVVEAVGLGGG